MRTRLIQFLSGLPLLVTLATPAHAKEPAIIGVEARLGQGITMGGGAGHSALRASTPTLAVTTEMAFRTDPWMSIVGSVFVEGKDRSSVGFGVGIRTRPGQGNTRAGIGLAAILEPYTLYGISAEAGHCFGESIAFCADAQGLAYLFGNDLPDDAVALQLRVVLGVRFDVY